MAAGKQELRDALGDDLTLIDELTDDEAGELLALFEAARTQATDDLVASLEVSLRHVPKLLRTPVRAILFPRGH